MKTHSRLATVAALAVAVVGLTAVSASAHTPSSSASCNGVIVSGASYEVKDHNILSIALDGGTPVTKTFATDGTLTAPVPQDAAVHSYVAKVTTTNPNPAYSKTYTGTVGPCGTQPPADVRYQDVVDTPVCNPAGGGNVTTEHQSSSRTYTYLNGGWVPGDWSPWVTDSTTVTPVGVDVCPPPTTPPPPPVPPTCHQTHTCHVAPHIKHGHIRWIAFSSCQPSVRQVKVTSKEGVKRYTLTHGTNRQRWVLTVWMHKHYTIRKGLHHHGPWVQHTSHVIRLRHVGSTCAPHHPHSGRS